MIDLSPRQIQILRAIINEFVETAEPIGSDTIDKKYNIGVSPATIRNEMVQLTKQGYLRKPHTSAGRIPTPQAMKLYVNELVKEKELTVADEISAKEQIWENRTDADKLLQKITEVLAERTHALGIALQGDERMYHSGYANLLGMPEFHDINVMRNVLQLIEKTRLMDDIFESVASENQVQVIYGSELGNRDLEPVGIIYISCNIQGSQCRIGAIGSSRFDYAYVLPMMKYVRKLMEEIVE